MPRGHVGELELHGLVLAERLAEGGALLRVAERGFEGRLRQADGDGRGRDVGEGAGRLRRLVGLEHQRGPDPVETRAQGSRPRPPSGDSASPMRKPGAPRSMSASRRWPRRRWPRQEDAGARRVVGEGRRAAQRPVGCTARPDVAAEHCGGEHLAAGQRGQPRLAHGIRRSVLQRPRADEMTGHGARHRDPAARQLFEQHPRRGTVQAETAEVRAHHGAEQAQRAQLADDRLRIAAGRLVLGDHRQQGLVDELADGQDHLAALLRLTLARGEGPQALAVALEQAGGR